MYNHYMDDCIEWMGSRTPTGYGRKSIGGKTFYTHRLAWSEVNGIIPEGMQILHRCDNPPCYNIEHLFLGTVADNMRDKTAKGRHGMSKKTECVNGHSLSGSNLGTYAGKRYCKTCKRRNTAKWRLGE